MKRLIALGVFLNAALVGFRAWQEAAAQVNPGPEGNGDVNGDGGDPCHGCNFALELGDGRTSPGFVTVHGDYDSSYTAHVLLVRRP